MLHLLKLSPEETAHEIEVAAVPGSDMHNMAVAVLDAPGECDGSCEYSVNAQEDANQYYEELQVAQAQIEKYKDLLADLQDKIEEVL